VRSRRIETNVKLRLLKCPYLPTRSTDWARTRNFGDVLPRVKFHHAARYYNTEQHDGEISYETKIITSEYVVPQWLFMDIETDHLEVPHWLYTVYIGLSKFTRLRAVSWPQHGSCCLTHVSMSFVYFARYCLFS